MIKSNIEVPTDLITRIKSMKHSSSFSKTSPLYKIKNLFTKNSSAIKRKAQTVQSKDYLNFVGYEEPFTEKINSEPEKSPQGIIPSKGNEIQV